MPKLKPPSIAARIRQALADHSVMVAWEPPADMPLDAVPAALNHFATLRRVQLLQAKDRLCYVRSGFNLKARVWVDPDLQCVFIGTPPAGQRRLASLDDRFDLLPGESAMFRARNRPLRRTQDYLNEKSSSYWAGTGIYPVFTVEALRPDELGNPTIPLIEHRLTRGADLDYSPARTMPDTQVIEDPDPYAPTRALPDPEPEAALWRDDDEPDEPLTP